MGILLENIYDLLVRPKAALQEIISQRSLAQALQVLLFSMALAGMGLYAGGMALPDQLLLLLLQAAFTVVFWALSGAVWHLLAELLGGGGTVKALLTALGFIYFLQLLIVPFYLLAAFAEGLGTALVILASAAIALWSAALQVLAIAVNYHLSAARALLVFFLPLIILAALIFIVIVAGGALLWEAASQFSVMPTQF